MDAGTSNLFRIILTYLQSRRSGHKQKKNSRTAAMQANIIPVITIACWSSSSHPGRESHLKYYSSEFLNWLCTHQKYRHS